MGQYCEVYISRVYGEPGGEIVRIEARDGAKLLSRIEISLTAFAAAMMGTGGQRGEFSTVRERRATSNNAG